MATPSEARIADPASLAREVEHLRREVERLSVLARRDRGLLEAVLEHNPHGIIVSDAQGRLVLHNRAAERIWGGTATADSVEGWHRYRAFHPDGRPYAPEDRSMARCLRTGAAVEAEEIVFERFDGTRGVMLGSVAPIYGADGRIDGALSVFADVTRFKDLEDALAFAERRALRETGLLYALADAANRAQRPEDVFEPALDAITAGLRVERASILLLDEAGVMRFRAWRGLSAAYRTAVEGHAPWRADDPDPHPVLVPDVRADAAWNRYRALFDAEGIRALGFVPLVHQRRLLGKFMVYASEPRALVESELQFVASVASHVSQAVARAKLYAEAEAARREAEAANRAKDEFISLLGHELRNPLSPIVTALHLMRLRDEQAFPRERGVIERQVRHLARLVDDLLDVSRIARGMVELRRARIALDAVTGRAIEMTSPLLEERGHHLEVDVPADLWVDGDEVRLAQVVGNLLHNAAKFTDPGGRIRIEASRSGDALALAVSDTGRGIAADTLPRLFEMFGRGPASDVQPQPGLGLGLAIVKSLVELHGGTVRAHSDGPGHGSTFVVRLPAAPGGAPTVAAEPPPAPARVRRRVLLVDDNEDVAAWLAEALRLHGHEVACAADAPTALRIAEAFRPDVALLDIGLPVMNGYELGARFAANPALSGLRLVAVTGYGQESDRARAFRHGFVEHLTKPVEIDRLLRVIAKVTAG